MNAELAQSLAIATHATMWLADSPGRDPGSGGLPSLPGFADLIAFDSVAGVEAWVERLADDGVDRLWFAVAGLGTDDRPADHLTPAVAGFLGGVPVGLLSTGSASSHVWQVRWSTATLAADGTEVLVANYLSQPASTGPAQVSTGTATEELDRALRRATQFAEQQQLSTWARVFAEARQQPERDGSPQDAPSRGVFPASWPDPDGPRLVDTALAAWVFGGMGSWNDLGFDDREAQQEYEQVSGELLETVLRACVAAVNIDLP